jgi:hypothetical protein
MKTRNSTLSSKLVSTRSSTNNNKPPTSFAPRPKVRVQLETLGVSIGIVILTLFVFGWSLPQTEQFTRMGMAVYIPALSWGLAALIQVGPNVIHMMASITTGSAGRGWLMVWKILTAIDAITNVVAYFVGNILPSIQNGTFNLIDPANISHLIWLLFAIAIVGGEEAIIDFSVVLGQNISVLFQYENKTPPKGLKVISETLVMGGGMKTFLR